MLQNYFKIALRNLQKGKLYSLINIAGLATGMAVALLIGIWIWDELSFDQYHKNHAGLAQVMGTQINNGQISTSGEIAIPLRNELQNKYGHHFKQLALTSHVSPLVIGAGEKKISESGMFVQPEFPTMFTLNMLKGNIDALKDPSSMLIAQSFSRELFGETDPINKIVNIAGRLDAKVAGIYEDLPQNTTLAPVKFLLSWDKYIEVAGLQDARTQWGNHSFFLYVLMNNKTDIGKTNEAIKNIPDQNMPGSKEQIFLHPMNKWHLYSDFRNGKIAGGRIEFVWLFGIIGVFVLLLACINFMNLSTARSEKRAKEVGIRKAIGSLRVHLIGQFLSESILMVFLAFFLAIILVRFSIPFFNGLSNKQMSIPWSNPMFWILMFGFALCTGLISGSYPAFYLSRFKPIKVLKGVFRAGPLTTIPRKVLVTMQFTVSIALIIGTIIVFKQIEYAKDRPVGYSREGVITLAMNAPDAFKNYEPFKSELLQTGVVENMCESSSPSTQIENNYGNIEWKERDSRVNPMFGMIAVTHEFGKTLGWSIKEGRDFSRNFSTDSGSFILNEAAVKLTGLKHPVGEIMKWEGKDRPITGVVKDLVMESPYKPIKPTIFFLQYNDWLNYITIKIKPDLPVREALTKIEPVFKKYNSGSPFDYKFVDEVYAKKFSDEERIGNLATIFATLAIFISCLGLFGLASFVVEQRTKEIGVRKVLGASVFSLWKMLSKDFVALVIVSCLIAVPIAWYILNQWLQNYEYRTHLSWWIFAGAGSSALIIILLTVSYHAIKASLMNPVKSLRTE